MKRLLLFAGCLMAFAGAQAQFTGFSVELVQEHTGDIAVLDGHSTYRVYADFTNATDRVSALFGDAATPLTLTSETGFYQSSAGGDFGTAINEGVFGFIPELEFDSWLTIGAENSGQAESGISQVGMTAALAEFNAGGNLNLNTPNGGSWFVTFGNSNAIAGEDLQVLVAQLTVQTAFSGSFNIQVFNEGVQANEEIIEASCFSTDPSAVFGCTDPEATNYVDGATDQCGACTYPCTLAISVNANDGTSCFGEDDAAVSLVQNGAQLGILYSHPILGDGTPYLANASFINLEAGDYTVNAVDGAGCTSEITFTVEEPDPIVVTASVSDPISCNGETDGVISGTATGGTGAFAYSLASTFDVTTDVLMFDGLGAGLYTVYVQDENGCTGSTGPLELDQPADSDSDGVCDIDEIAGCTNPSACNFAPFATEDDGSCLFDDYDGDGVCNEFEVEGCTFSLACNYNPEATDDDGSCEFYCPGCTDETACNYDSGAIQEDGSCQYPADLHGLDYVDCDGICITDSDFDGVCDEEETFGCTDEEACNYLEEATQDDGGCLVPNSASCEVCEGASIVVADADGDGVCDADEVDGCTDEAACNFDPAATEDDGSCTHPVDLCGESYFDCSCECLHDADGDEVCDEAEIAGCQDPIACNFNAEATDPAPCETTSCAGCIYPFACNYDPDAVYADGSCEFGTCAGCTDPAACNFNPTVSEDDGTCAYLDECGVCGGEGPAEGFYCDGTCVDSDGDGVCDVDEAGCMDEAACNYNAFVNEDDGSCTYADDCIDCDGECFDLNANQICDCQEILGCLDETACNYDTLANVDSGACLYPEPNLDCNGNCLNDADEDGVCDEQDSCPFDPQNDIDGDGICAPDEVGGCTDQTACNYNAVATDDDGSCILVEAAVDSAYNQGFSDGMVAGVESIVAEEFCGEGTIWDSGFELCIPLDCFGDFNDDGERGTEDLLQLLAVFGTPCPLSEMPFACGDAVSFDNYDYETVQIGSQCWFAENLRTEHYANGDAITGNLSASEWTSTSSGAQAIYDNDVLYLETFGRLYNWYAVDDSRGLCPSGWHVPTDGEWMTLEMELGMTSSEANSTGWRGTDQGAQLKASPSCDPSWNGTNISGFSALPGGYRYANLGHFSFAGDRGYWWSASQNASSYPWCRFLYSDDDFVNRYSGSTNGFIPQGGFSVRCLREADAGGSSASVPTVSSAATSDLAETTATLNGEVISHGGDMVSATGFIVGADSTLATTNDASGSGTSCAFTASLAGLTGGARYYFSAYATNGEGTAYGDTLCFTTETEAASFACGPSTVTYDGHAYETVQIGSQCWFAENLRTEHYANGDAIPGNLSDSEWTSTSSGAQIVYGEGTSTFYDGSDDESANLEAYGRLYNWYAVDDSRGLCPSGWHVPTDSEWMILEMELGMTSSEANSTGWRGTDQGAQLKASPSGYPSWNGTNTSGFLALPGGWRYDDGAYNSGGAHGCWWSASPSGTYYAWRRYLYSSFDGVLRSRDGQRNGFSVRCLRDE